jgi:hypothetical protein
MSPRGFIYATVGSLVFWISAAALLGWPATVAILQWAFAVGAPILVAVVVYSLCALSRLAR